MLTLIKIKILYQLQIKQTSEQRKLSDIKKAIAWCHKGKLSKRTLSCLMCMCLTPKSQNTWVQTDRQAHYSSSNKLQHFSVCKWQIQQAENSKDIVKLNKNIIQMGLIDIYRILIPITAEHTVFSSSYGISTKL